ncbi:hypothetical protein D3C73_831760 [compost metagenome]
MIEHGVNVERHTIDRALVGEHFHTIDQRYDPVGLVADQPRQRAVVIRHDRFEQLRRTADA